MTLLKLHMVVQEAYGHEHIRPCWEPGQCMLRYVWGYAIQRMLDQEGPIVSPGCRSMLPA